VIPRTPHPASLLEISFLHARFCGLSCRMTHATQTRTSPAAAGPAAAPISPAGRTGDRPRRDKRPRVHRPDVFPRRLTLSAASPDAFPPKLSLVGAQPATFRRSLPPSPARHDTCPARLALLPVPLDTFGRCLTLLARKLTHFGRFRP